MKLDPVVKEKWLEALRSGKYSQYRNAANDGLNKEDKMPTARCCINVGAYAIFGHEADRMITSESSKVLGFDCHDSIGSKLITMNDREERDFLYIADYIEENL